MDIRMLYTEKIVKLQELGVPAADMKVEVRRLLTEFVTKQITKSVTDAVLEQLQKDEYDEHIKIGGSI